jgi:hypothetical protein
MSMNEQLRLRCRRTLIHELGHCAIGHIFDVPIESITLYSATLGKSKFALQGAIAASPYRPWNSILGMIAVAGISAEHISSRAQTSADEIIADLSHVFRGIGDYKWALAMVPSPAKAADLRILVDDVRGMLGPKIRNIVQAAHQLAEERVREFPLHKWVYEIPASVVVAAVQ